MGLFLSNSHIEIALSKANREITLLDILYMNTVQITSANKTNRLPYRILHIEGDDVVGIVKRIKVKPFLSYLHQHTLANLSPAARKQQIESWEETVYQLIQKNQERQ